MPIVGGGLDIHRKQIHLDLSRTPLPGRSGWPGRPGRPGATAPGWPGSHRPGRMSGVRAGGLYRLAVRRGGAGRGRRRGACRRACADPPSPAAASARAKTWRDPLPASSGATGAGPAAGVLDPAGADPGVPGAAGKEAVTTCAASTPPGSSGSTRCSSTRARRGWARAARCAPNTAWPGRAAPGRRHLPVACGQLQVATALAHVAADPGPDGHAAPSAAARRPAPGRRPGTAGPAVRRRPAGRGLMTCWLAAPRGSPRAARRSGSPGWMSPSTPPTASVNRAPVPAGPADLGAGRP